MYSIYVTVIGDLPLAGDIESSVACASSCHDYTFVGLHDACLLALLFQKVPCCRYGRKMVGEFPYFTHSHLFQLANDHHVSYARRARIS
jgi:hypothetical protein